MIYLLDTHVLIWSMLDPGRLSKRTIRILENPLNSVVASSISFWEISLKYSIGKLDLEGVSPHEFPNLAEQSGFDLIPLLPEDAASCHLLQGDWHRDPFDRMLIHQAIGQGMTLVTKDQDILKYQNEGLKTVW